MVSNQVIRMEEDILSLLPCEETQVYAGCIRKTIGCTVWICPLYGLSDEKNQIEKSEQYTRLKNAACSFRILDGTHYALRYRLLENGYQETGRFLIGAYLFTEENRKEKEACPEKSRFFVGQDDKGSRTVIESRENKSVGLLGADCLFLPDGER